MKKVLSDLSLDNTSRIRNSLDPIAPQDLVTKNFADNTFVKILSPGVIAEYTADPVSPVAGQVWVLKTMIGGSPSGLLLALTQSVESYSLSYKTISGKTVRINLT